MNNEATPENVVSQIEFGIPPPLEKMPWDSSEGVPVAGTHASDKL